MIEQDSVVSFHIHLEKPLFDLQPSKLREVISEQSSLPNAIIHLKVSESYTQGTSMALVQLNPFSL